MRDLVEPCLYNWLGYGNPNGKYWFIGTEEGGAEIWRNQTLSLEESLRIRAGFDLTMDFKTVWEDLYHIPMTSFKGATVWLYIAAYLLAFDGVHPGENRDKILTLRHNGLGKLDGNHFLGELLPLPKERANQIAPYKQVWSSLKDYHNEVEKKRFQLITQTLLSNPEVQLIISYDRKLTQRWLTHFEKEIIAQQNWEFGKKQRYQLSQMQFGSKRQLNFLSTPFFGNGQISYEGVWQSVQRLKQIIPSLSEKRA